MTEPLTVQQMENGAWYIAYDGQFLGDDRKFSSKIAAEQELENRLAIDKRDAARFERPLLYHKG